MRTCGSVEGDVEVVAHCGRGGRHGAHGEDVTLIQHDVIAGGNVTLTAQAVAGPPPADALTRLTPRPVDRTEKCYTHSSPKTRRRTPQTDRTQECDTHT